MRAGSPRAVGTVRHSCAGSSDEPAQLFEGGVGVGVDRLADAEDLFPQFGVRGLVHQVLDEIEDFEEVVAVIGRHLLELVHGLAYVFGQRLAGLDHGADARDDFLPPVDVSERRFGFFCRRHGFPRRGWVSKGVRFRP